MPEQVDEIKSTLPYTPKFKGSICPGVQDENLETTAGPAAAPNADCPPPLEPWMAKIRIF